MTLTETLDRLPPCLVRLVARNGHSGQRLSLHVIAERAGMSYSAAQRLSLKKTWKNVPPKTIDAFCFACSVDILHPRNATRYLKRVLSRPDGFKLLATDSGPGCARNVLKLLASLSE